MVTTVRLVWIRHRFELIGLTALSAACVALAAWLAIGFASVSASGCSGGPPSGTCLSQLQSLNGLIPLLQAGAAGIPPLGGLLLGVGLVAREIELGTTVLAWSYTPSRTTWLWARIAALLGPLLILTAAIGLSLDAVYAAALPQVPSDANLQDIQLRGLLPAGRAALAFAAALLLGALVGRQLPAVVVGIAAVGLLVAGTMALTELMMRTNPVIDPGPGGIITDSNFRTADGRILTEEEAVSELPSPDADFWSFYTPVHVGIPGSRAPLVSAASLGVASAGALILLGMSTVVVERRRPY